MRFLLALILTPSIHAAAIHGSVRDASHHPIPNASVYLEGKSDPARTNAQGAYRFEDVPKGSHSLRATVPGSTAASAPFVLDENETKQVDLVLAPEFFPAFFDEPKFVVAGVTAGNYQGGHGSDVVLRSTDALTKELNKKASPRESTASLRQVIARDPNNAELHHQLADADEAEGNPLEAVTEYQRAAELAPTEPHLFDWATELLTHRADTQATEVFTTGHRLHPDSVRMLLGLATSWYARGSYDQAGNCFFAATELNPADPTPYLLLGKVRAESITHSPAFMEKMERFARLHPENAQANFFYAASLWTNRADLAPARKVEALLQKSVQLDPSLSAAYLVLGVVYSDLKQFPKAIESFQQAIRINPDLEEARYRLAQAYRLTGHAQQAQEELKAYHRLSAQSSQQAAREHSDLQQFVIQLRP